MIKLTVSALIFVALFPTTSQALPETKPPSEIVRALRVMQDQIAAGDINAQVSLPKFINQLGERLLAYEPEAWREPKNVRALAIYTLSGGQPRVARKALESNLCAEPDKELLTGALAYVEGREAKARQFLQDIDPQTLPPAVGGHLALVQASLLLQRDVVKAMQLLDLARLLSPGSLVEEAALRREIFMADEIGDIDKFVSLSDQYMRRFKNSPYSENFRTRFAASVGRFSQRNDPVQLAKLDHLLDELKTDERLTLYLTIAQTSIIRGKATAAHLAADKAMKLAKEGSLDAARARFYSAAVAAVGNDYETGFSKLESLSDLTLPKRDADLKEAMIAMARQSHKPLDPSFLSSPEPAQYNIAPDTNLSASATALIDLAQEKLGQTDELVRDPSP